jgi:hypothetical protein
MSTTSTPITRFGRAGSVSKEQADSPQSNSIISIFQPGVQVLYPGDKKPGLQIRILPSHDENMDPNDPAFARSVVPYRDRELLTNDGHLKFSGWFATLQAYDYVGNGELNFLSRSMLPADLPEQERMDPMHHLRTYAWNTPAYKHLASKPPPTGDAEKDKYARAVLQRPSNPVIYNVLAKWQGENTPKNFVAKCSLTAHDFLEKQLNAYRPAHMAQPHDPDYPNYLLGDVTHTHLGLTAQFIKHQVSNTGSPPWTFVYTPNIGQATADTFRSAWALQSWEQLEKRRYLMSSDTLYFPTYQELVDILIDDGFLNAYPDLVARACGAHCNVPVGRPVSFQSATTGGNFAPPPADDIPMSFPPASAPQAPAFSAPQAPAAPPSFAPPVTAPLPSFAPPIPSSTPAPGILGGGSLPPAFPAGTAAVGSTPAFPGTAAPSFTGGLAQSNAPAFGTSSAPSFGSFAGAASMAPNFPAGTSPLQPPPMPVSAAPFNPPAAPPPPAAPVPPADLFWVCVNGATQPKPMTEAEASALQGQGSVQLTRVGGDNVWRPLASAPPAAPPAAAVPPPPAAPSFGLPAAPALAALNEAELQAWGSLLRRATENIGQLTQDEMTQLGDLQNRASMNRQSPPV